ncbi:hypothetical protein [Pseudomonas sp. Leaf48]|uniref:hypothetical protein n=1 Tax=Pseudomonas sp. Leaf48 TaxID=1736221 RepID=UPI000AC97810|nr:hypothetical protein [Pseudomonas sp. Leaf48]
MLEDFDLTLLFCCTQPYFNRYLSLLISAPFDSLYRPASASHCSGKNPESLRLARDVNNYLF